MTALPTDREGRLILAGEYVLGTLDTKLARAVAAALAEDAELAAMVAEFEQKLAPLASLAVPEAAPTEIWDRIEAAISASDPIPRARSRLNRWFAPRSPLWPAWALAASLVAAVMVGQSLRPHDEAAGPVMSTVLVADAQQAAWLAEVDAKGGLRLAAVGVADGTGLTKADRDLQLWALAPGGSVPVSLGLVPHGQARVSIDRPAVKPEPGMSILISLEPRGGAPGALPTGPVVFAGRLAATTGL